MSGKPTVISTFAGTGGSSLGYHWAGFKELLAIDWDSHAVECFKLNFPDVPVWHRDITKVEGKDILEFCQIKAGELDVFDGSPPCQGFSTAGKREVNDSRNYLFEAYVQLVHELQPKVFVMENVSGMAKGTMKGQFIKIMQALKSLNYQVKAKQMNAMYYGVPQSRERIIFIGVRNDLNKVPIFPIGSKKLVSAKIALEGVTAKRFSNDDVKKNTRLMAALRAPNALRPWPTITRSINANGIYKGRYLSVEETMALCGFPINWALPGSPKQAVARLGNAVMPKFMQAIAETIKTKILERI